LRNTQARFEDAIKGRKTKTTSKPASTTVVEAEPGTGFLDLPPELRNRVYALFSQRELPLRLRRFKPPAIARVSRQLRWEALPVFFDINTFVAEIVVPFSYRLDGNLATFGQFIHNKDDRFKRTGTLQLTQDTMGLFKLSGKATARVRKLIVVFVDASKLTWRYRQTNVYFPTRLLVKAGSSSTQAYRQTTSLNITRAEFQKLFAEDLAYLMKPVEDFVDKIASGPDFKGFSIPDLKKLAHTVRQPPRDLDRTLQFGREGIIAHTVITQKQSVSAVPTLTLTLDRKEADITI
jgi:hypothetical protein